MTSSTYNKNSIVSSLSFSLFSHNRVNILLLLDTPPLPKPSPKQDRSPPPPTLPPKKNTKRLHVHIKFTCSYQVYVFIQSLHVHTKFTCSYKVYLFIPCFRVRIPKFTCAYMYQVYMFISKFNVRHKTLFNQSINTCSYRVYMFILVLYIHPTKMSNVLP